MYIFTGRLLSKGQSKKVVRDSKDFKLNPGDTVEYGGTTYEISEVDPIERTVAITIGSKLQNVPSSDVTKVSQ